MWMRHGAKACLLGSTPGKANHKPCDLDWIKINKLTMSPAYQSLLVYRLTKFFLVLSFLPHCDDDPLSDFDTHTFDDFNIDGNSEDVEESC